MAAVSQSISMVMYRIVRLILFGPMRHASCLNLVSLLRPWLALGMMAVWLGNVRADGGVLIATLEGESFRVSVFAGPVPFRAGPVDLSVYVEDLGNGGPVLDAQVRAAWEKISDPPVATESWKPLCCRMDPADHATLQRAHGGNRLLYGAWISLPDPGTWNLAVEVQSGGQLGKWTVPLEVGAPMPPWRAYWLYLIFPIGVTALFAMNRAANRQRFAEQS
jgi:hypothetical protein